MKLNLENYLYQLDNTLKPKTQKDLYMIYIMVIALTIGLSYILLFSPSEQSLETAHTKVQQMQTLIVQDKSYLAVNSETALARLNNDILHLKQTYTKYKNDNDYIKYKISQISSLFYNEKSWGKFLDSISANAKEYNVKLLNYHNKYIQHGVAFGHVLDINIKATGTYQNTLKFVNSLEQSFLVVDVHDLSMQAKEKLYTDLNISVWGIRQ